MEENTYVRITFRMPKVLHAELELSAAQSSKSLNAELVARLENATEWKHRAEAMRADMDRVYHDSARITQQISVMAKEMRDRQDELEKARKRVVELETEQRFQLSRHLSHAAFQFVKTHAEERGVPEEQALEELVALGSMRGAPVLLYLRLDAKTTLDQIAHAMVLARDQLPPNSQLVMDRGSAQSKN